MARKKKNAKKECEKKHFEKRCLQRVGHIVKQKDLLHMIWNRELEFYYKESNTRTCFIWNHEEQDYVIVYDNLRKVVVTIFKYKDKSKNKESKINVKSTKQTNDQDTKKVSKTSKVEEKGK